MELMRARVQGLGFLFRVLLRVSGSFQVRVLLEGWSERAQTGPRVRANPTLTSFNLPKTLKSITTQSTPELEALNPLGSKTPNPEPKTPKPKPQKT